MNKYETSWEHIKNKLIDINPEDVANIDYLVSDTNIRSAIKKKEWNYTERKYEVYHACPRCFYKVRGFYNYCPHCGLAVRIDE